jgi:hypothetical protein
MHLNTRIETFPANIIADHFAFRPAEYFKAAPEDVAAPKVDLSINAHQP